jgi:hypothetical protein
VKHPITLCFAGALAPPASIKTKVGRWGGSVESACAPQASRAPPPASDRLRGCACRQGSQDQRSPLASWPKWRVRARSMMRWDQRHNSPAQFRTEPSVVVCCVFLPIAENAGFCNVNSYVGKRRDSLNLLVIITILVNPDVWGGVRHGSSSVRRPSPS